MRLLRPAVHALLLAERLIPVGQASRAATSVGRPIRTVRPAPAHVALILRHLVLRRRAPNIPARAKAAPAAFDQMAPALTSLVLAVPDPVGRARPMIHTPRIVHGQMDRVRAPRVPMRQGLLRFADRRRGPLLGGRWLAAVTAVTAVTAASALAGRTAHGSRCPNREAAASTGASRVTVGARFEVVLVAHAAVATLGPNPALIHRPGRQIGASPAVAVRIGAQTPGVHLVPMRPRIEVAHRNHATPARPARPVSRMKSAIPSPPSRLGSRPSSSIRRCAPNSGASRSSMPKQLAHIWLLPARCSTPILEAPSLTLGQPVNALRVSALFVRPPASRPTTRRSGQKH